MRTPLSILKFVEVKTTLKSNEKRNVSAREDAKEYPGNIKYGGMLQLDQTIEHTCIEERKHAITDKSNHKDVSEGSTLVIFKHVNEFDQKNDSYKC